MASRRIYASSNGDTWDLSNLGGQLSVVHRPNAASGGTINSYDLVAFLSHERNSPQNMALVALVSTLVDETRSFDSKQEEAKRSSQRGIAMSEDSSIHFALVVDDDPTILMLAMTILEDAGFHPLSAMNGDKAMEALEVKGDRITLLFTDVQMPGNLNGFQLAQKVAARWPHIGILVASGNIIPKPYDLPAGAKFVGKPFSADVIHDRLHELLPDDSKPAPLVSR